MTVSLTALGLRRSLALVGLFALGCKLDSSLPVDPVKIPSAPLFGHSGLGGTVIQTPLEADVAASDTVFALSCMGSDAFESGLVAGMKSDSDLNCTSTDVTTGAATIHKYGFPGGSFTDYTGQPITCPAGSMISLSVSFELIQTANASRTDVGIWVAQDNGTAITGRCAHYTLASGVTNVDGDRCGDLLPNVTVKAGRAIALVSCDSLRDGLAHIGSCFAWKDPGTDRVCAVSPIQEHHYSTLPANKAKCNCAGVDVAINIAP